MTGAEGDATPRAVAARAARGAAWLAALRGGQRGAGLLRLVLVTHLLGPADLGTMGVALLALAMLQSVSQTGFQQALIQRRGDLGRGLDVAFTLGLLRGGALAGALVALAPVAAAFFEHPEAAPIVRVVALSALLQSLQSPGTIALERGMRFRSWSLFQGTGTLADVGVSLVAAWLLRDAWALVLGLLAGDAVRLVASYAVHPHRPRLCLARDEAARLLGFGKWLLLSNVFLFLAHHGDDALVGRLLGVGALGLYQLAYQLVHAPILEATRVASQVALPSYSALQGDRPALRRAWLEVLQGTALLAWPFAALAAVVGPDVGRLLLAERWHAAVVLLPLLGMHAAVRALGATNGPVFLALGRPWLLTALTFAKCAALAVLLVPAVWQFGLLGAAGAVLAASLVSNVASNWSLVRALACPAREVAARLGLPLAAALVMTAGLLALREAWPAASLAALAGQVAAALGLYAGAAALLLRAGPRPLSDWLKDAAGTLAAPRPAAGGKG